MLNACGELIESYTHDDGSNTVVNVFSENCFSLGFTVIAELIHMKR